MPWAMGICVRVIAFVPFQISRIVLHTMRLHTGGIYILQSYENTHWKDVQYFVTNGNSCPSLAMCTIMQRWILSCLTYTIYTVWCKTLFINNHDIDKTIDTNCLRECIFNNSEWSDITDIIRKFGLNLKEQISLSNGVSFLCNLAYSSLSCYQCILLSCLWILIPQLQSFFIQKCWFSCDITHRLSLVRDVDVVDLKQSYKIFVYFIIFFLANDPC